MADADETEVTLHLYDLTQGMARQMSQQLLGIYLEVRSGAISPLAPLS
jgi:hypothetical protein